MRRYFFLFIFHICEFSFYLFLWCYPFIKIFTNYSRLRIVIEIFFSYLDEIYYLTFKFQWTFEKYLKQSEIWNVREKIYFCLHCCCGVCLMEKLALQTRLGHFQFSPMTYSGENWKCPALGYRFIFNFNCFLLCIYLNSHQFSSLNVWPKMHNINFLLFISYHSFFWDIFAYHLTIIITKTYFHTQFDKF